jgi:hypothetical protein
MQNGCDSFFLQLTPSLAGSDPGLIQPPPFNARNYRHCRLAVPGDYPLATIIHWHASLFFSKIMLGIYMLHITWLLDERPQMVVLAVTMHPPKFLPTYVHMWHINKPPSRMVASYRIASSSVLIMPCVWQNHVCEWYGTGSTQMHTQSSRLTTHKTLLVDCIAHPSIRYRGHWYYSPPPSKKTANQLTSTTNK